MTAFSDLFQNPSLFSRDNPVLQAAERTHRLLFEAFDRTARLQLAFAADLVDMNRERFESLYARQPLGEWISAQQDLALDLGKRTARHVGNLQDVLLAMQLGAAEAANEKAGASGGKGAGKKAAAE